MLPITVISRASLRLRQPRYFAAAYRTFAEKIPIKRDDERDLDIRWADGKHLPEVRDL